MDTEMKDDIPKLVAVPQVPEMLRIPDSVNKILKDLQEDQPVEDRTIIRWTSVHPSNGAEFHYAAIFAGGAWYTTAPTDNQYVQRIMQHEDLIAYLNRKKSNLKNINIAVDFVSLNW